MTSKFLYAVVEILLDFINQTNDRDTNVIDFHHPSQITKAMDFSLPDTGLPLEQLVTDCRSALRYQVRTDGRSWRVIILVFLACCMAYPAPIEIWAT